MAYRFTNTEKWEDSWFSSLKQIEMLLFMYLCDNCDIAGFAEVNIKRWAFDLNSTPDTIETEDHYTRDWDMETRSWFFPEEPETYDALEEEINSILAGTGANYRIEGVF